MTTIPYVYNFNPGGRTTARFIKGIYTCLNYAGDHHWQVVEDADTDTVGWTKLKVTNINGPAQIVKFVAQGNYIEIYHTPPGGTESPFSMLTGGLNTTATNLFSEYGMSGVSVYVVELKDAICVYNEKRPGSSMRAAWPDGILSCCSMIGRVFSPHDRNKNALEYGILSGVPYTGNSNRNNNHSWLHYDAVGEYVSTTYISNTANVDGLSQSMVYSGVNTIGENGWIRAGSHVTMNRLSAQPTPLQTPFLSDIKSGDKIIQRFSPISVMGPIVQRARNITFGSSNVNRTFYQSGWFGSTRYFRASNYGVGDVYTGADMYMQPWIAESATIKAGDIFQGEQIGWRQLGFGNHVVIWCRGGNEVEVGTITI